jgi:hypothetical protein
MRGFSIGGRTVATAATANHAAAELWNPSATKGIYVTQIAWSKTVATADNIGIVRSSARGTARSTVTPAQQNDADYQAAPPSGAVLDLSVFSVQPTLISATAFMFRWNLPAAIGSGFILPLPDPIFVPAGTGLVILTPAAVILQPADVTYFWRE